VVDRIRSIGDDPTIMAMTLEQARARALDQAESLGAEITIAERDVRQIQTEIARIAIEAGTNGHAATRLAELHERLRKAECRLSELRDQVERVQRETVTKAEVDSALGAFSPIWDTLSPREQARILQLLIKRVEYDGEHGKVAVTFHANGLRTLGQREATESQEAKACPAA